MARRCPDCDVAMEPRSYTTSFQGDGILLRERGGLLGRVGLRGERAEAFVCPDCGLVRFYVDVDD